MHITIQRVDELTEADRTALRELSQAVYPPAVVADWPGRSIQWAEPFWSADGRDDSGRLVAHAGVQVREGLANGIPVKIGGIGGVKTHPANRGQGAASLIMERVIEFFAEQGVDFALLVCCDELVPFYERRNWRLHTGELVVIQAGKKVPFTFNHTLLHPVRTAGPTGGVIDLQGFPW